jgi:hypothetical protein
VRVRPLFKPTSATRFLSRAQNVDPAVLEAARPFLTGNPDADADILKFYEAKAKLLQKLQSGGPPG